MDDEQGIPRHRILIELVTKNQHKKLKTLIFLFLLLLCIQLLILFMESSQKI